MTPETAMSREDPEETESVDDQSEKTESVDDQSQETESTNHHLAGIEDGAGCTEIWEHLSRNRGLSEETGHAEADDD